MMRNFRLRTIFLSAFIGMASLLYLSGILNVPFHPDESTYIYTSSDFELFLQKPSSLFWKPDPPDALRQRYRLLDPPLAPTWIGFARWVTDQPALPADWDWSKSWEENSNAGALPDSGLLQTARLSIGLFFPLTLFFAFRAGKALGGELAGWSAMLLTWSNALILLHTRRAMAEGLLVMGVFFSLWALTSWKKHLWLSAIPLALAFNAKYSAAPLVLVGIGAILWKSGENRMPWRQKWIRLAGFLALFGGITLLLNPFLWAHPFQALTAALNARVDFMAAQSADYFSTDTPLAPATFLQSLLAMTVQLFFTPPASAEVANYLPQTQIFIDRYLANPFNSLLRSFAGGGVQLGLVFLGLAAMVRGTFGKTANQNKQELVLFLGALLFETIFMLVTTNVAFQRYYMVLVPMVVLTGSLGISSLVNAIRTLLIGLLNRYKPHPPASL
ncbi:MAG: ArnT family glycosyltransferase [Bellilinea sp.]